MAGPLLCPIWTVKSSVTVNSAAKMYTWKKAIKCRLYVIYSTFPPLWHQSPQVTTTHLAWQALMGMQSGLGGSHWGPKGGEVSFPVGPQPGQLGSLEGLQIKIDGRPIWDRHEIRWAAHGAAICTDRIPCGTTCLNPWAWFRDPLLDKES